MLRAGTCQVWWADAAAAQPALAAVLSEDETARWRRLRVGGDSYLVAHALARTVVGAAAGIEPDGVDFGARCTRCGDVGHGKPYPLPPADDVVFSLSHSHDRVVVAVARRAAAGIELGVDVERLALRGEVPRRHVLTEHEQTAFDAATATAPERRPAAFIRYWTRKEAAVKATGHGMTVMTGLTVSGPDEPASVLAWDDHPAADATLVDLDRTGEGYAGCLAVLGGPVSVSEHDATVVLRAVAARVAT